MTCGNKGEPLGTVLGVLSSQVVHNGTVAQGQGGLQAGSPITAAGHKSYSALSSSSIGAHGVRKQPKSETNTNWKLAEDNL